VYTFYIKRKTKKHVFFFSLNFFTFALKCKKKSKIIRKFRKNLQNFDVFSKFFKIYFLKNPIILGNFVQKAWWEIPPPRKENANRKLVYTRVQKTKHCLNCRFNLVHKSLLQRIIENENSIKTSRINSSSNWVFNF
jgi:hypothetical protein